MNLNPKSACCGAEMEMKSLDSGPYVIRGITWVCSKCGKEPNIRDNMVPATVPYHKRDHIHCTDQKDPACGIKGAHRCCLCEEPVPRCKDLCDLPNAVKKGRATWVCPRCGHDCSLAYVFYAEAVAKDNEAKAPSTTGEWEKSVMEVDGSIPRATRQKFVDLFRSLLATKEAEVRKAVAKEVRKYFSSIPGYDHQQPAVGNDLISRIEYNNTSESIHDPYRNRTPIITKE